MRGTAGAGGFVGWVSIAIGAVVVAIGYFAEAAQASRALLVGTGMGCIASGVMFLLLAGILTTLLDLREDAQQLLRTRPAETGAPPARPADPRPPRGEPLGSPPPIPMPSRYEMMMRHGERVGAAAWDRMRAAAKAGTVVTEAEALAEVRQEQARPHG